MRTRYYRKLVNGSLERITAAESARLAKNNIRIWTEEEEQIIALRPVEGIASGILNPPGQPTASTFDPSGMVKVPCGHGEFGHPITGEAANAKPPIAGSWIRGRYVDVFVINRGSAFPTVQVQCPVCRGELAPPDLATPANA